MKRVITSFMCFALCIALFAQATSLTIDNQTPGWLSSKINYGDQQTVQNLKVTGYINGTDLRFIGNLIDMNLKVIDLGDANIVGNSWNGSFHTDKYASYHIQKLIMPHSLTSYSEEDIKWHDASVDTLVFDTKINKIGEFETIYKREHGFRRKIGHLILGENVDSILCLTGGDVKTVHLPTSLKYVAPCACEGHESLAEWNIREFSNLEEMGYCAFADVHINATGNNSNRQTLPDSIFLPKVQHYDLASFEYKTGMHIFLGDDLIGIHNGVTEVSTPYCPSTENVSFHFKNKSPIPIGKDKISSTCTIYVPKGAKQAYQASNFNICTIIEGPQPLEDIALDKESILMEVGEKAILTATPVPENADDINMIWSVDKPEVISVTEDGEIEALSSGTAVITITSTDGKIEKKCTVCVKTHATDAAIEPSEVIFNKLGDIVQLQVVVLPEEAYDKSVKWTSSNPSVCTVTTQGKVVAMGYGDAVIMAITNDGEIPATCVVKVMSRKPKLTYMVDGAEYQSDEYEVGESVSLIAAPEKDNQMFVGWSIDMPTDDVTLTAIYAPITSINTIKSATDSFQIFTPDGIRRNVLQPGVNILRYSDGSEKKVVIQ